MQPHNNNNNNNNSNNDTTFLLLNTECQITSVPPNRLGYIFTVRDFILCD